MSILSSLKKQQSKVLLLLSIFFISVNTLIASDQVSQQHQSDNKKKKKANQSLKIPGEVSQNQYKVPDTKMPTNSMILTTPKEVREKINIIFFLAYTDAVHRYKYGISIFEDPNVNQSIRDRFIGYEKMGITISEQLVTGIMSQEDAKSSGLFLNFQLISTYFYNFILADPALAAIDTEKVLAGSIAISDHKRIILTCETYGAIFVLFQNMNNIMVTLSRTDFPEGEKKIEMEMNKKQDQEVAKNIRFLAILEEYRNYLGKNMAHKIVEAEDIIDEIECIKITQERFESVKDLVDPSKQTSILLIANITNCSTIKANFKSKHNTEFLDQDIKDEYDQFLSVKNGPNFLTVKGKNGYVYILPRYNPSNEWYPGIMRDRFDKATDAVKHGNRYLIHRVIDNNFIKNGIQNNVNKETIITIRYTMKGDLVEEKIKMVDFIARLKSASLSPDKNKNNGVEKFFAAMQNLCGAALIEAAVLLNNRKSFVNRAGSEYIELEKATITIDSFLISGVVNSGTTAKTHEIVISFTDITQFFLESLRSDIVSMVDTSWQKLNSNNEPDAEIRAISDALMKAFLMNKIRAAAISTMFEIDTGKRFESISLPKYDLMANNMNQSRVYYERLLHEKKNDINTKIENHRDTIYVITFPCGDKAGVAGNIATLKEEISYMKGSYKISELKDRLAKKNMIIEFSKKPFSYLPSTISDKYKKFLNSKNIEKNDNKKERTEAEIEEANFQEAGGKNFFIGKYNNLDEIKSGSPFIFYILPRYDERQPDIEGVYQEEIVDTEIICLHKYILYPFMQDTFQRNKDRNVNIITFDTKEAGLKVYSTKLFLLNAAINLETYYNTVLNLYVNSKTNNNQPGRNIAVIQQNPNANAKPQVIQQNPNAKPQVIQQNSNANAKPQVTIQESNAKPEVTIQEPNAKPQVIQQNPNANAKPQVTIQEPTAKPQVIQQNSNANAKPQVIQQNPNANAKPQVQKATQPAQAKQEDKKISPAEAPKAQSVPAKPEVQKTPAQAKQEDKKISPAEAPKPQVPAPAKPATPAKPTTPAKPVSKLTMLDNMDEDED